MPLRSTHSSAPAINLHKMFVFYCWGSTLTGLSAVPLITWFIPLMEPLYPWIPKTCFRVGVVSVFCLNRLSFIFPLVWRFRRKPLNPSRHFAVDYIAYLLILTTIIGNFSWSLRFVNLYPCVSMTYIFYQMEYHLCKRFHYFVHKHNGLVAKEHLIVPAKAL